MNQADINAARRLIQEFEYEHLGRYNSNMLKNGRLYPKFLVDQRGGLILTVPSGRTSTELVVPPMRLSN